MTYAEKIDELHHAMEERDLNVSSIRDSIELLLNAWHNAVSDGIALNLLHEEPTEDRGETALQAIEELNALCNQVDLAPFAEASDEAAALVVARDVSSEAYGVRAITPEPPAKEKASKSAPKAGAVERGEKAAARYLEMYGYEILERNWKCPAGEVDIIARDGDAVVFVDVKTRTSLKRGLPAESVGDNRRARFEKIAGWYLRDYEFVDVPIRFDTVALLVVAEDRAIVRHFVNSLSVA